LNKIYQRDNIKELWVTRTSIIVHATSRPPKPILNSHWSNLNKVPRANKLAKHREAKEMKNCFGSKFSNMQLCQSEIWNSELKNSKFSGFLQRMLLMWRFEREKKISFEKFVGFIASQDADRFAKHKFSEYFLVRIVKGGMPGIWTQSCVLPQAYQPFLHVIKLDVSEPTSDQTVSFKHSHSLSLGAHHSLCCLRMSFTSVPLSMTNVKRHLLSVHRCYSLLVMSVRRLSGKYPAILNISRTGRVALM
jgi:hypothetical protein